MLYHVCVTMILQYDRSEAGEDIRYRIASPCHDRRRGDTASFLVLNYEAKFFVF